MENLKAKPKNKNKKPLYILLIFIGVFSLFVYWLLKPSLEATAITEINSSINIEDVKGVFYKYKSDLITSEEFCQATRDKLNSFGLKQSEIAEIKKWLPSKTDNINIIVVPDLSNRITDNTNNENQIKRDSIIIDAICENFEKKVKLKMNSKDKLTIDVTDRNQAGGKVGELADTLKFNLENFKDKSNRLYFDNHKSQFKAGVQKLYEVAYKFELEHPKGGGADYVSYFSTTLKSKIKKSTLDDNYTNILIILTDGYLEATKPDGSIVSYYNLNPLTIDETSNCKLRDVEVFLLDFNRKKGANDSDEKRLKKWWFDWLKSMNVKNATDENTEDEVIVNRVDGYTDVKRKVEEIINRK
jgi:hypothetical protein